MAASDVDLRIRLHKLLDDLGDAELRKAETALNRLSQAGGRARRPARHPTLYQALGLAATDRPPPNDEDVERWLEEERMKKYGP